MGLLTGTTTYTSNPISIKSAISYVNSSSIKNALYTKNADKIADVSMIGVEVL